MPPITSRKFQRAAAQRFMAAEALQNANLNLDAQYIGGYVVECSLKALILDRTPKAKKAGALKEITSGATMHKPEALLKLLQDRGVKPPPDLRKRMRRSTDKWATDLRYETRRRNAEETIAFLATAKAVYDWVETSLS